MLQDLLPLQLFNGRLSHSKFLQACLLQSEVIPPRLSLLIALAINRLSYSRGAIVYQRSEHPINVFLVDSGIFAHVGRVTHDGGVDDAPNMYLGSSLKSCHNLQLKQKTPETQGKGTK